MRVLIRYRCPECQQALGSPRRKEGKTAVCPNCEAQILVPLRSSAEFRKRRRKARRRPTVVPATATTQQQTQSSIVTGLCATVVVLTCMCAALLFDRYSNSLTTSAENRLRNILVAHHPARKSGLAKQNSTELCSPHRKGQAFI